MKREYKHKIAILIPYFGKFPWYFNYFLHSCSYNLSVNYFIITDDHSYDTKAPGNIRIIHQTFAEFKELVRLSLKMDISIEFPYKICDFRPAFGIIFSNLFQGFDFWGMGDIDLVYGNIRNFITNDLLEQYDVITVRHDFLVGYFTLFRNCKLVNELFKRSSDYKAVFTNRDYCSFDECSFAYLQMTDEISFEQIKCKIDSMTHVVKRMDKKKLIKAYFNVHVIEGVPGNLTWNGGRLIYKRKFEIMLYHMIQFKKRYKPTKVKPIKNIFRISPTRIY